MPDLFTRSGGRQRLIKMESFMKFFASDAGPFEMKLPDLVERIGTNKGSFLSALARRSQDGKTLPTAHFLHVLKEGFPTNEATERDWEELRYIADPYR